MQPAATDTQPRRVLLSILELPVALGLAFSTFVGFSAAGCKWAHCVDLSGIPWYLGGALIGLTVGILYWVSMMRLRDRFGQRLVADAIAIVTGVSGYVVPQFIR